jgi:tight adherence protein C
MSLAVLEAATSVGLLAFGVADLFAVAAAHGSGGGRLERLAVSARRLAPGLASHEALRIRAAQAGLPGAGEDLLALKAGAALVAALLTLPLAGASGPRTGAVLLAVAASAAFFVPDFVLVRRIARRRARIALELPALLDLLSVTVGAGLPITAALSEVATRQGGLLGAELRAAQRAAQTGSLRGQALATMRDRCPHEGVAAMISAIARADRHGAPLGPALAAIAADARQQRARAIREHAARAAPQIQLVIALGLVPATMLIVAAGLLGSFG